MPFGRTTKACGEAGVKAEGSGPPLLSAGSWPSFPGSGPNSGVEHSEEAGRAVRLFSAAEALRDAIGAPMSLSNQLLYGRLIYRVRSQLSEAEYERLRKEGREMTMEQAITCTLKD
jgi:hypothetical protein